MGQRSMNVAIVGCGLIGRKRAKSVQRGRRLIDASEAGEPLPTMTLPKLAGSPTSVESTTSGAGREGPLFLLDRDNVVQAVTDQSLGIPIRCCHRPEDDRVPIGLDELGIGCP